MRLSQAIREGCKGTYQVYYTMSDGKGGFCAAGSAEKALMEVNSRINDFIKFLRQPINCPVCTYSRTIDTTIPHLNDFHRWTREAIADWVSTLEGAELVESVTQEKEVVLVNT